MGLETVRFDPASVFCRTRNAGLGERARNQTPSACGLAFRAPLESGHKMEFGLAYAQGVGNGEEHGG